MKLNLNLPYTKDTKGNISLSNNYINYAVNQKYKQDNQGNGGIHGQLLRLWGRIQAKLDDAQENNIESVELEKNEAEFIKKCFTDDLAVPTNLAKFIMLLQDEVENLKFDE